MEQFVNATKARRNLKTELALVVCTKDRPDSLSKLLDCIDSQSLTPGRLLIVDSSQGDVSKHLFRKFSQASPISTTYLKAEPGLPHQRNVGIYHLMRLDVSLRPKFVWFLDDDIEFDSHYLERGIDVFNSASDLALLGSYDVRGIKPFSKLATSIASLQLAKPGKLLRSGLVVPPYPKAKFEECDFVPGFSMLFDAEVFDKIGFDGSIRMYGEDLEFQMRLSALGKIGCSSDLRVVHNSSPLNRDSWREVSAFSDGFRWRLHKQFPDKVQGSRVIISSALLFLFGLILSIVEKSGPNFYSALGHRDFLCRLVRKEPVEQRL